MSCAKKKIFITAIIAVAVIAAATLCFVLTIAFTFNNEAALCAYLNENGVTEEDLSLIVSGVKTVADTFKGVDDSYYKGANALYALAVKFAGNRDVVQGATDAYCNAPMLGNPFPMLKYASVLREFAELFKDKTADDTSFVAEKGKMSESVTQILSICEGISEAGKENFDEASDTLHAVLTAENVTEEVSYKAIVNLALYAVDVTKQADFSKAYIVMDGIFGSGFCDTHAEGIKSATAVLRSADYDTLLALSGYLPDQGTFAAAVCNYAVSVQGFDGSAFCRAFAAAMNALYLKQGNTVTLDPVEVQANFNALAQADPDALDGQDNYAVQTAALYFQNAFSALAAGGGNGRT